MSFPNRKEEAVGSILGKLLPAAAEGHPTRDAFEKALKKLPIDLLEALDERIEEPEGS